MSIRFHSSRPESFAIYKRTTENGEWIPYQYYSASCERTYGLRPAGIITEYDESKAVCSDEYSDISPLSGGTVAFSTLEGRPSSRKFETSKVLQVRDFFFSFFFSLVLKTLKIRNPQTYDLTLRITEGIPVV